MPLKAAGGMNVAPYPSTDTGDCVSNLMPQARLEMYEMRSTISDNPSFPGLTAIWTIAGAFVTTVPAGPTPLTFTALPMMMTLPPPLNSPFLLTLPMTISGAEITMRLSSHRYCPSLTRLMMSAFICLISFLHSSSSFCAASASPLYFTISS